MISVARDELLAEVKWLTAATPGIRLALPETAGISLDASEGLLRLGTTNLESWAEANVAAKVDQPLSALVPVATFGPIVTRMGGERVTLSLDGERMLIESGRARATLPTLAGGLPPPPEVPDETFATKLAPMALEGVAARIGPAVRTIPGMPHLHGVHLGGGYATAADEYRVHRMPFPGDLGITVPLDALSAVAGLEEVHLRTDGNKAEFSDDWRSLTTTLVAGKFPTFKVFDLEPSAHAVVNREEATAAVQRAAPLRDARLELTLQSAALGLRTYSADGEVEDRVELAEPPPAGADVTVRPNFLLDALKAMGGDEVTLGFLPGGLRVSSGDVTAIVMGMR